MTKASVPTIHCDSEYGCDAWELDNYEMTVSSINGVRVSQERRAPGWFSTLSEDYCPKHLPWNREEQA